PGMTSPGNAWPVNLQPARQPGREVRRARPKRFGRPSRHLSEALPSTLPSPEGPRDGEKASRKWLSRLALCCRGDRIRTSGLLNPIPEGQRRNELSPHEVTSDQQPGCTSGCTNQGKPEQADPLAALAAALMGLSAEDRARLAAMLLGRQEAV